MFTIGLLIGLAPFALYGVYKGVQLVKKVKALESDITHLNRRIDFIYNELQDSRTSLNQHLDTVLETISNKQEEQYTELANQMSEIEEIEAHLYDVEKRLANTKKKK